MWKSFLIHESYCNFELNEGFDENYIWSRYMNLADVVYQMKIVIIHENSFKFMIHTVSDAIECQLACSLKDLFRFQKFTFERIILLVCFSTFFDFSNHVKGHLFDDEDEDDEDSETASSDEDWNE